MLELEEKLENGELTLEMYVEEDPRKGVPYAAKLKLGADGKVVREFLPSQRFFIKRNWIGVQVSAPVQNGDLLETRQEVSWRKDYRQYWAVWQGKLYYLGYNETPGIWGQIILPALQGKIPLEELVEKYGREKGG